MTWLYGITAWGNTYSTTLQPLFILQKRAIRLMTFTSFHEYSSPIFRKLNIIKLDDLTYHIAVIMYRFNNLLLLLLFLQLVLKLRHKPINIKNAFTKRDTNCSYWKENNNLITAYKPLSWNLCHVRPLLNVEFLMSDEHLF